MKLKNHTASITPAGRKALEEAKAPTFFIDKKVQSAYEAFIRATQTHNCEVIVFVNADPFDDTLLFNGNNWGTEGSKDSAVYRAISAVSMALLTMDQEIFEEGFTMGAKHGFAPVKSKGMKPKKKAA